MDDQGRILIPTKGSFSVPGVTGKDEDILRFSPATLGPNTSGNWDLYFDGSDVGLTDSSEDLNAVSYIAGNTHLFSTTGSYSAAGGSGADEDISRFEGNYGTSTSGSISLELDLSGLGISTGEDMDGLSLR